MWRHIAFIYEGGDHYSFYLNATVWPILVKKNFELKQLNPDIIFIGYYSGSELFKGSMACISIFERALSQEELQTLMLTCP